MLPACAKFSREVKQAGCGIMIDGFGRQSVTFAMLESLMPDFVKVDGSIVRKLLKTPGALNKMNAVVRVGQAAGFGVVAECVEEPEILQQLKSLGVGYAQGFGVARPQAIEEVAAGAKDGAKRGTG
jgi:EAL domain-containing protein (putative c-di-GMP-specific phosphodiesterase class I)